MKHSESNRSLTEALATWRVNPSRDPEFRGQVWQRIAARKAATGWTGFMRAHAISAAGLLAMAVVFGAWTGHARARDQAQAQRAAMVADYVQSLDVRAMMNRP